MSNCCHSSRASAAPCAMHLPPPPASPATERHRIPLGFVLFTHDPHDPVVNPNPPADLEKYAYNFLHFAPRFDLDPPDSPHSTWQLIVLGLDLTLPSNHELCAVGPVACSCVNCPCKGRCACSFPCNDSSCLCAGAGDILSNINDSDIAMLLTSTRDCFPQLMMNDSACQVASNPVEKFHFFHGTWLRPGVYHVKAQVYAYGMSKYKPSAP